MSDPVERAVLANELMWTAPAGRSEFRALRAAAVAAAIGAGHTEDHIASRLGVKPADLDWIMRGDLPSWTTGRS